MAPEDKEGRAVPIPNLHHSAIVTAPPTYNPTTNSFQPPTPVQRVKALNSHVNAHKVLSSNVGKRSTRSLFSIEQADSRSPAGKGMPWGLTAGENASKTDMALDKPQKMTSAIQTGSPSRLIKEPSICPTDQESLIPIGSKDREGSASTPAQKKVDKKSWDYIIRSGVSGGVAGCAVCGFYNYKSKWSPYS